MYSTPLHSSLKFDATISLNLMDTFTLSYSYETKKKNNGKKLLLFKWRTLIQY